MKITPSPATHKTEKNNLKQKNLLKIIIKIPVRGSSMVFNKAFCAATVSFSPL